MKHITVLGEGAWGTAIATLLAHNGHTVSLWCYDSAIADDIKKTRINTRYLPGITLDARITPTCNLSEALCGASFVFEAVPVAYLRSVLENTRTCFDREQTWIILSKGIEQKTLVLPTQIIDDVFACDVKKMVMVGPSFASDVAAQRITAVTLAASDCQQAKHVQTMLANEYFRPYLSTDMIGTQVGAALKNVITLGVGMLDGAGYSDNAKAFFITRGLSEIANLSVAMGGKSETVYGLSGVGDLVLTATSMTSKNLRVGQSIGKGILLATITKEFGAVPEGVNTVQAVHELMRKHASLELPLCKQIYDVIFQGKTVTTMMDELMKQPLTTECEE